MKINNPIIFSKIWSQEQEDYFFEKIIQEFTEPLIDDHYPFYYSVLDYDHEADKWYSGINGEYLTSKEAYEYLKQHKEKVELEEIKINKKNRIGSGFYKDVYNIESNPNLVVKAFDIGDPDNNLLKQELELSKNYPELFAKIYKLNMEKGYMVQEKLDTKSFENISNKLQEHLPTFNKNLSIDIISYLYDKIRNKDFKNIKEINSYITDKNIKLFYQKLIKYFKELNNVYYPWAFDISKYNLGFDKKNNIKLLDI